MAFAKIRLETIIVNSRSKIESNWYLTKKKKVQILPYLFIQQFLFTQIYSFCCSMSMLLILYQKLYAIFGCTTVLLFKRCNVSLFEFSSGGWSLLVFASKPGLRIMFGTSSITSCSSETVFKKTFRNVKYNLAKMQPTSGTSTLLIQQEARAES